MEWVNFFEYIATDGMAGGRLKKLLALGSPEAKRISHTYRMAPAQGVDVEEGEGLVALEELEARDIPL
jgi:hypothetical protein